jgi:hypothetical protein
MKYIALVLVASSGLAGASGALAQAPDFASRPVSGADGGIIGGGHRVFIAGGSEMLIADARPAGGAGEVSLPGQPGRHAAMDANHGDGPQVRYLAPLPHSLGRHALAYGGGDELVIRYVDPAQVQLARR